MTGNTITEHLEQFLLRKTIIAIKNLLIQQDFWDLDWKAADFQRSSRFHHRYSKRTEACSSCSMIKDLTSKACHHTAENASECRRFGIIVPAKANTVSQVWLQSRVTSIFHWALIVLMLLKVFHGNHDHGDHLKAHDHLATRSSAVIIGFWLNQVDKKTM